MAHHQLLEYSITMHQTVHCFKIYMSWLLNLLFFKWLIYGNDYLTFYNNMEKKENMTWWYVGLYANPGRSVIFTDFVIYTICSINRRFFTCLHYAYDVYKDSWNKAFESDSLHGHTHYIIKWHFQRLSAGRTYLT